MDIISSLGSIINSFRSFYIGTASPVDKDGFISLNGIKARVAGNAVGNDVIIKDSKSGEWVAFVRGAENQVVKVTSIVSYLKDPSVEAPTLFFFVAAGVPLSPSPNDGTVKGLPLVIKEFAEVSGQILYGEYPPYYGEVHPWLISIPSPLVIQNLLDQKIRGRGDFKILPDKSLLLGSEKQAAIGQGKIKKILKTDLTTEPSPTSSLLRLKLNIGIESGRCSFGFKLGQSMKLALLPEEGFEDGLFGCEELKNSLSVGFETKKKKDYRAVQQLYLHRFYLKDADPFLYIEHLTDYPIGQNVMKNFTPAQFEDSAVILSTPGFSQTCTDDVCINGSTSSGITYSPRNWVVFFKWKTNVAESRPEIVKRRDVTATINNRVTILMETIPWVEDDSFEENFTLVTNTGELWSSRSPFIRFGGSSNLRFKWTLTYRWKSIAGSTTIKEIEWVRGADEEWIEFTVAVAASKETITIASSLETIYEEESPYTLADGETTHLEVSFWVVELYWVNPILETPVQQLEIPQVDSLGWIDFLSYRIKTELTEGSQKTEELEFYTSRGDPYTETSSVNFLSSPFWRNGDATNLWISICQGIIEGGAAVKYKSRGHYTGFRGGYSLPDFPYPPRYSFFKASYRFTPNPSDNTTLFPYIDIGIFRREGSLFLVRKKRLVATFCRLRVVNAFGTIGGFGNTGRDASLSTSSGAGVHLVINVDGNSFMAVNNSSIYNGFLKYVPDVGFPQYGFGYKWGGSPSRLMTNLDPDTIGLSFPLEGSVSSSNINFDAPSLDFVFAPGVEANPVTVYLETLKSLYAEYFEIKDALGNILYTSPDSPYYCLADGETFQTYNFLPISYGIGGGGSFSPVSFDTTHIRIGFNEGGYEYLIEEKFIWEGNSPARPLKDMLTFPNEVTSFDLNRDPRSFIRERVHGLTHLSPLGDIDPFSATIEITEPASILAGDITPRADGTIKYRNNFYSPYLAPLYSESTHIATSKNFSGYIEYTEGLIADMDSGDVLPCFAIYYGQNKAAPISAPISSFASVDFQIIFVDLKDTGKYDVVYRYRHSYFTEIGLYINTSFYPVTNIYNATWLKSFFDTGFNKKDDYTIAGEGTDGSVAVGHNLGTITTESFILNGSAQDGARILALPNTSLGSINNGDFIFQGTALDEIEGYGQIYLIENGDSLSPIKKIISPFDFNEDFYLYMLLEQKKDLETNKPDYLFTLYISRQGNVSIETFSSWLTPIFTGKFVPPDPLATPLLKVGQRLIRLLCYKTPEPEE